MDQRAVLQPDTALVFETAGGAQVKYVIREVIGRGSLCVLYEACYLDTLGLAKRVKIKEFNPVKLHAVRAADLSLQVPDQEKACYARWLARVVQSYVASHRLSLTAHMTNAISNAENLYRANGTVYIVYAYMQGEDLAHHVPGSMSELLRLAESAAATVHRLHEAGYLYLDMKPENVLILDGTTDLVQLFDFDSLIPIGDDTDITDLRITFSKGFSPVEQRLGECRSIGRHSDVYSIGALLFYMIFGRAPRAADANRKKPYDFSAARFDFSRYPDALARKLSELLTGTLQSFIGDRYGTMAPVLAGLAEARQLAAPSYEAVLSRVPPQTPHLIGRGEELAYVRRYLAGSLPTDRVLFVTGMGGIGKSTVVTAAVQAAAAQYDGVSFMTYRGSVQETLADDSQLCLHTVTREPSETTEEYARRKLAHLRKICRTQRVLLVLDNYEGGLTAALAGLFGLGCRLLVVTRNIETDAYPVFAIGALKDRAAQRQLFLANLKRDLHGEKEQEIVEQLLDRLGGHPLSIELLAKQICASHLTLAEALALVHKSGVSGVGRETVLYEKDVAAAYRNIRQVLTGLYQVESVSGAQRVALKLLSLCSLRGVELHLFAALHAMPSMEDLNVLWRAGWLSVRAEQVVFLHPLIREVLHQAPWTAEAAQALCALADKLQQEIERCGETEALAQQPPRQRLLAYARDIMADPDLRAQLTAEQYENLWCTVAAHLQRDDEAFILDCARRVHPAYVHTQMTLLKLWDITVRMLCEARQYEKARAVMAEARRYLANERAGAEARAFYYGNIEGEYYDALVYDPAYVGAQKKHIAGLLRAGRRALLLARRGSGRWAEALYVQYLADQINTEIRVISAPRARVQRMLRELDARLPKLPRRARETELTAHLAHMWFAVLYEAQYAQAVQSWERARDVACEMCCADLEIIDALLVPRAEVELRFGRSKKARAFLRQAASLCDIHGDALPYVRKKQELLDHMRDT